MGVGGQCDALAALPPGKTWYPLYTRLGRPQCYNLELIICEYNIVARKIRNVKFKNALSLQNSLFQTQL